MLYFIFRNQLDSYIGYSSLEEVSIGFREVECSELCECKVKHSVGTLDNVVHNIIMLVHVLMSSRLYFQCRRQSSHQVDV